MWRTMCIRDRVSAIKISTGIWQVAYNAENLPVCFVDESAKTVVECTYDLSLIHI